MKKTFVVNDEELAFLKAMAKRDGVTLQEEIQSLFNCEIFHWMELYEDELRHDGYLKG